MTPTSQPEGTLAGFTPDSFPLPGTSASQNPEPDVVTAVRQLVATGHDRQSAADKLADRGWARTELQDARVYWLQQMRRYDWDDYTGSYILRIIEDLLFGSPRHGTPV